jgi:DNA-directed RNA polymerase subunit M/transcription elongation factor TFIIS
LSKGGTVLAHRSTWVRKELPVRNETHAGPEARARVDEAPAENADDADTTASRVPCDYCGDGAVGYDLKEQANLCNDCAVFPSALVEGRSQLPQVKEFPAPPVEGDGNSTSNCIECGDLLVIRDDRDSRCVECLLDHLSVGSRSSSGAL